MNGNGIGILEIRHFLSFSDVSTHDVAGRGEEESSLQILLATVAPRNLLLLLLAAFSHLPLLSDWLLTSSSDSSVRRVHRTCTFPASTRAAANSRSSCDIRAKGDLFYDIRRRWYAHAFAARSSQPAHLVSGLPTSFDPPRLSASAPHAQRVPQQTRMELFVLDSISYWIHRHVRGRRQCDGRIRRVPLRSER